METWIEIALALGFSYAVPLNTETLTPRRDVRDMCAADKCRAYGKNHTCPPYCGTLEACREKMGQYSRGILLQTVGNTEKLIDTKAYRRIEQQHLETFHRFCEALKAEHPHALCLGSGGCRICRTCAWPEPCRFPDKMHPCVESQGINVVPVMERCGMEFQFGCNVVTWISLLLY